MQTDRIYTYVDTRFTLVHGYNPLVNTFSLWIDLTKQARDRVPTSRPTRTVSATAQV